MKRNSIFLCLLLVYYSLTSFGQEQAKEDRSRIKLGIEVPVQYSIGYEHRIIKNLSLSFHSGILTKPNTTLILKSMKVLGADEAVLLMVENAFKFGWVFESGVNYYFNHHYAGIFGQQLFLTGKETPNELVEEVFDVNLSGYPHRRTFNGTENQLTLKSGLLQLGILYGYKLPLKDNKTAFQFELGISKNVSSKSSIGSESRDYATLSQEVDAYLFDIYHSYAYIPSISVLVSRRFF